MLRLARSIRQRQAQCSQGYKHPYQGKIPGQDSYRLFYESAMDQEQGMLESVKGRIRIQGKVQMR